MVYLKEEDQQLATDRIKEVADVLKKHKASFLCQSRIRIRVADAFWVPDLNKALATVAPPLMPVDTHPYALSILTTAKEELVPDLLFKVNLQGRAAWGQITGAAKMLADVLHEALPMELRPLPLLWEIHRTLLHCQRVLFRYNHAEHDPVGTDAVPPEVPPPVPLGKEKLAGEQVSYALGCLVVAINTLNKCEDREEALTGVARVTAATFEVLEVD